MIKALKIQPATAPDHSDSWALRLAQRALAALLEGNRHPTSIHIADLRRSAVAALSALSVDDRGLVARWLSLQLLNASDCQVADDLTTLHRIDEPLAMTVRALQPMARARFSGSDHARGGATGPGFAR